MKNKRHEAILEIVQQKSVATQEELQKELRSRGFEVTQATVSRDIRRLHLLKQQVSGGRSIYVLPSGKGSRENSRLVRVLKDSVKGVDSAQNILVIRTEAGMAMAAAAAIDGLAISGILGCIAGDDTIIAVLKTTEAAELACEKLSQDLQD